MENSDGMLFRVVIAIASRGGCSIVAVVRFFGGDGDRVQRDLLIGGNLSHGCDGVSLGMRESIKAIFRGSKVVENESPGFVRGKSTQSNAAGKPSAGGSVRGSEGEDDVRGKRRPNAVDTGLTREIELML